MLRDAFSEFGRILGGATKVHARLRRHLGTLLVLTFGVDLVCSVLAYVFEHGQKGGEIKSYGTAIFWTTTQLLTVSSSMANPVTTGGRVIDVFMEFWAISLVTAMAGAIGTFLMKKGEGKPV